MAEKTVSIKLAARADAYKAAMKEAEKATTNFSRSTQRNIKQLGSQMQSVGKMMTAGVTLPIVGGSVLAVKAAMDWESAWAGVTKTVDGTAEQMSRLEDELRSMAKELPASHAEIAAVAEAAGQLGVGVDDVASFTRVMIDLGETTNMSANEAATALAQFMNVMGTSQSDVSRLGSAVVGLGNNFATTEADIVNMSTRIAAAGRIVGLTEDEVLGFSTALSSVGIEAEAGGTAFSRVITSMAQAVAQGGEKLDGFAKVAGQSASEFAAAFRADPAAAIASFIDGLGGISAAGGDVFTTLELLGLSDVRVKNALLSMASNTDLLSAALGQSKQSWIDNIALSEEARKRYDTLASQFEIVRNKIVDLFIDLGEAIMPAVTAIVDGAGRMMEVFQGLPGPVKAAVVALAGIAAAAGPMIWITGSLVKNFVALRAAMLLLGSASAAVPWLAVAAAVAAVGTAIYLYATRTTDAKKRTQELNQAVTTLLDGMKSQGPRAAVESMFTAFLEGNDKVRAAFIASGASVDQMVAALTTINPLSTQFRDLVDQIQAAAIASGATEDEVKDLTRALYGVRTEVTGARARFADMEVAQGRAKDRTEGWIVALEREEQALSDIDPAATDAAGALEDLELANKDASRSAEDHERALRDLISALEDQFDAMLRMGDSTFAAQDAQERFIEAAAETAAVLADVESSAEDVDRAVRSERDAMIDAAQAAVRLAEDTAAAERRTLSATEKIDAYNQSLMDNARFATPAARRGIYEYLIAINQIPPEKATEILALVDQGKLDEADRKINQASKTRQVAMKIEMTGEAEFERKMKLLGRTRTATVRIVATGDTGVFRAGSMKFEDSGTGMTSGPTMVAERRPEIVSGYGLLTSPQLIGAGHTVTSGANTEKLLKRIAAALDGQAGGPMVGVLNVGTARDLPATSEALSALAWKMRIA